MSSGRSREVSRPPGQLSPVKRDALLCNLPSRGCSWAGVAYVCFIIDVFSRMIVGWRYASRMRTEMVLDAIEMARWARGTHHADLRCHSDPGPQFTSIRYGERLAEIGATPSDETVGDSYD